ncbi:hypothetical protein 9F7_69 [uncultured Caudovirales phage]|uniref:Uncharacterized protein n=1 Tax=uncultured Caudovirales phage TaxID=2100421 RepID=A0A2H4JA69_9CAUD|nr:hypothetical protein 3S4_63 [uncultured Caudovirales phage]ASN68358.1 hypothetical protein 3F6_17 [uncultured Caudovirales phage]ASN68506.1 hypothetical protein 9F7_69 [uncultured Caudovirales phage]ASN68589.1 hypothetical protein 8S7_56 [uncultured Caudovirales phage]ASN72140.1 hypothetical protein 7F6_39 [uncultured Caudovirales phage]
MYQPPEPSDVGRCLRCSSCIGESEQVGGICYDCQPAEQGSQPAFPVQASDYGGHGTCFGLTVRDYFAAKAMNGYLANPWQAKELDDTGDSSGEQMRIVAEISYAMADAMLAARVKQ